MQSFEQFIKQHKDEIIALLKEWKAVPGDDIWLARMLEKLEREREAKEKTSAKK